MTMTDKIKIEDIVKSNKYPEGPSYCVKEVLKEEAKVVNLSDMYTYTIPLKDLYKIEIK